MDIHTFTLLSNEIGGVGTLVQASGHCGGDNISPQLSWINAPKETKSFAVTIYDQSVPSEYGFWHWFVINIPAKMQTLPSGGGDPTKGLLPSACIQLRNDYGEYGYGGPCPPVGDGYHLYLVTVYALDVDKLSANKDSLANPTVFEIWEHTIQKASIVMYFKR